MFLERELLVDALRLEFLILMCVQKFLEQEINMNGYLGGYRRLQDSVGD